MTKLSIQPKRYLTPFWLVLLASALVADEPQNIRILSYNIHHAEGTDQKLDLDRIAGVIRQAKPDVVALQEVDAKVLRSKSVDQPAELARLTGMYVAFGPNIPLQGGEYGNALLSRWPIVQSKNHALPCLQQGEQRGVLESYIQTPQGIVRCLATHFDHRRDPSERTASVTAVNELLRQDKHSLTFLIGDLNATWDSPELKELTTLWQRPQQDSLPTIPADEPNRQIDFVLYSPASRCTPITAEVMEEKIASDHRPLLTTLAIQPQAFPPSTALWNGYPQHEVQVDGRSVIVVVPKQAAPGRPWVWHGEFFGHKPAPDIALLERGFHLVYMKIPDMLGSPPAVKHWNECYHAMTREYGLAKKVALVGLSRGGLYCYNWAIANPDKVACIYADAPVCDFKSWPGGKGASARHDPNWKLVLKHWEFADDEAAFAYDGNPVDRLEPLAEAGVPLLHVFGDADEVVPWEENTGLIAERYPKLGGKIELIRKPGVKHHPHGLDDSTPIVDFIVRHAMPPGKPQPELDAIDAHGFHRIEFDSTHQRGRTQALVLMPSVMEPNRRYPVIYVLPVEPNEQDQYGQGLVEIQKADLHNRYQTICVAPTFSDLPWYADHPSDTRLKQESYFVDDVRERLRWELPQARFDRHGQSLLGFSKSGYGAWSILLRHPEAFERAVAWDAPLMMDAPGKYGSGPIYGTPENFTHYRLTNLLRDRQAVLQASAKSPRLIHFGYGNFRDEHQRMEALLQELNLPHVYVDGPERKHHWNSGWLSDAFAYLSP